MKYPRNVILASASPRRHEILSRAGIDHTVITADADEKSIKFENGKPGEYVLAIAGIKNDAVCATLPSDDESVVISADTIVYFPDEGKPIGKPKDESDAFRMLSSLSGRVHEVVTGVVVRDMRSGTVVRFYEVTKVRFRALSPDEISDYIASGDPMDKAGSYGLQSGGCVFVEAIEGDYFNVVGLPICRLNQELKKFI